MPYKYSKYITIGEMTDDGKRQRKRFYGNTKIELEENIRKYFAEKEKVRNPSEMSFKRYADQWTEVYKSGRSFRTQEMYHTIINKCKPIWNKKMSLITKTDLQKIIQDHWDTPRQTQVLNMGIKQIFRAAVIDGIIAFSPAEDLTLPKRPKTERRLLTEEEVEAARNAELAPMDRMFLTILMVFGLRPQEALALTKKDFDFKRNVLVINKAVKLHYGEHNEIADTKNGNTRGIPIPNGFKTVLDAYKQPYNSSFLFSKQNGQLCTAIAYQGISKRILKAINKELGGDDTTDKLNGMQMYSFRHFRATQLYYLTQKGKISTKKAAYLMGHTEQVFLMIYSHIDDSKENLEDLYQDVAF